MKSPIAESSRPHPLPSEPDARQRGELGALLRLPAFRALFAAHLVSNLGDWLAFLALFSLAAIEWQASATRIALLAVAYVVPLALVAPLAGVFVDRWELRRVLIASDLVRAALVTGMAFASNHLALCALLFLHQSCGCFFNPAQSAALPRLVDRRHLLGANALTAGAAHASKILGPAIAGSLVAAFGWRGCIVADAVSFALSALVLTTLPVLLPAPSTRSGSPRMSLGALWNDLRVGWAFWAGSGSLRTIMWLAVVAMAALGGFLAVIAVYARDQLGAGPRSMGFLLSSLGAGAILGAFAVARFTRAWPRARVVCLGLGVMGAAFAMLVPGRPLQLAYVALFTLGAAAAMVIVPAQTLLQEATPPALLGRVMSSAVATIGLTQGASMLVAGPISTRVGFAPWLVSIAAVLTGCALIGFLGPAGRARNS